MTTEQDVKYKLYVEYDFDFDTYQEFDKKIAEAIGHSSGAGTGFGKRDHAWYHLSLAEATQKLLVVSSLELPGIYTAVSQMEQEEI